MANGRGDEDEAVRRRREAEERWGNRLDDVVALLDLFERLRLGPRTPNAAAAADQGAAGDQRDEDRDDNAAPPPQGVRPNRETPAPRRVNLQARHLLALTPRAQNLLQADSVFAQHDGRYAWINRQGGNLFVHSLRVEASHPLQAAPPADTAIVQLDAIVPLDAVTAAPPCRVFLDLLWPGAERRGARRVVISLIAGSSLALQFLLLCIGKERNACYAGTCLGSVYKAGREGERVYGGNYDRQGGTPLFPLDRRNSSSIRNEGNVYAKIYNKALSAQFAIITQTPPQHPDDRNRGVFGNVVEGTLDVVRDAIAERRSKRDIQVVDCGVVVACQAN